MTNELTLVDGPKSIPTAGRSFDELRARLSARNGKFVDEYLRCLNAALSARRVGYAAKTARAMAWKVMKRPAVAKAIDAGLRELSANVRNDADRITRELMLLAYADPIDLVDLRGDLLPVGEMAPEIRAAITSVDVLEAKVETSDDGTVTTTRVVRVKLQPKIPALELLGKRLKMFSDRLELGAGDTLSSLIRQAYDRPHSETPS